MKKWLKVISITLAIIIITIVLTMILFPDFLAKLSIVLSVKHQYSEKDNPRAYAKLEWRDISNSMDTSNMYVISYDGLSLRSPWGKEIERIGSSESKHNESDNPGIAGFKYENDEAIAIRGGFESKPLFKEMLEELYTELEPKEIEKFKKSPYYNIMNDVTEFEEVKLIYGTSPEDISINKSLEKLVYMNMFLVLKEISMYSGAENGLYQFKTDKIKGFQFGDFNKVALQIYDKDEKIEYFVLVNGATKEELDAIISSISIENQH